MTRGKEKVTLRALGRWIDRRSFSKLKIMAEKEQRSSPVTPAGYAMMKKVYLSQVRGKGGLEKRLMAYMEYLMISVIVHAKRRRGNPMES